MQFSCVSWKDSVQSTWNGALVVHPPSVDRGPRPALCNPPVSLQNVTQRSGSPVFDTLIELQHGEMNTWTVVRNVFHAVDALLGKKPYEVERRTRIAEDPQVALVSA